MRPKRRATCLSEAAAQRPSYGPDSERAPTMPAQHGTECPYHPGTRDRGISDSTGFRSRVPAEVSGSGVQHESRTDPCADPIPHTPLLLFRLNRNKFRKGTDWIASCKIRNPFCECHETTVSFQYPKGASLQSSPRFDSLRLIEGFSKL